MSTCGKYSQHPDSQNKNPDPCRPLMMGNSDLQVSIPAGFPMGIPVVSHRLPGLMLSLTLTPSLPISHVGTSHYPHNFAITPNFC